MCRTTLYMSILEIHKNLILFLEGNDMQIVRSGVTGLLFGGTASLPFAAYYYGRSRVANSFAFEDEGRESKDRSYQSMLRGSFLGGVAGSSYGLRSHYLRRTYRLIPTNTRPVLGALGFLGFNILCSAACYFKGEGKQMLKIAEDLETKIEDLAINIEREKKFAVSVHAPAKFSHKKKAFRYL